MKSKQNRHQDRLVNDLGITALDAQVRIEVWFIGLLGKGVVLIDSRRVKKGPVRHCYPSCCSHLLCNAL